MNDEEFRGAVESTLAHDAEHVRTLDSGTFFYRISPVDPRAWKAGYVSSGGGRWTLPGEGGRYLAEDFSFCARELGLVDSPELTDCVFEIHRLDQDVKCVDVSTFPPVVQQAIYEESNEMPSKWYRSHMMLEILRRNPRYAEIRTIYAPSASGLAVGVTGMCLALDPLQVRTACVATGGYANWKNQDFIYSSLD